jgi:hypothetical protein
MRVQQALIGLGFLFGTGVASKFSGEDQFASSSRVTSESVRRAA